MDLNSAVSALLAQKTSQTEGVTALQASLDFLSKDRSALITRLESDSQRFLQAMKSRLAGGATTHPPIEIHGHVMSKSFTVVVAFEGILASGGDDSTLVTEAQLSVKLLRNLCAYSVKLQGAEV